MYAVDAPHRILWGGEAAGIVGIHEWRFEPTDEAGDGTAGGTEIVTRESWSGPPVSADLATAQSSRDGSLVGWLAALKAEVERRQSGRRT